jgi:beta-glucosidase
MTRDEIEQTANNLLNRMTLKEKVWMLNGNWDLIANQLKYKNGYNPIPIATNGVARLGVPPVKFCDGPRGAVVGK